MQQKLCVASCAAIPAACPALWRGPKFPAPFATWVRPPARQRARLLLQRIDIIRVDNELLDAAASLDARILRSLDAIHLAGAQLLSAELDALVTYDRRMRDAAALVGIPVEAPA